MTQHFIEYGRFTAAPEIMRELERTKSPWLILKEHGIMWTGNTPQAFEKFVRETLKIEQKRT